MLEHLFLRLANHDANRQQKERREFDDQFNNSEAEHLPDDCTLANRARDAVLQELQNPQSAIIKDLFIRRCPDGVTRAAGTVMIMAQDEGLSAAGYTVEFRSENRAQVLDLVTGFEPVAVKSLSHERSADTARRMAVRERRDDRAFLKGCIYAVGVTILLIAAGLIYCWLGLIH